MKLSNLILKAIFFTAIASTFLAFVINTLFEYNNFLNEKDQMRKDFTEQKKSEIKREVNKMYNYISYNENNIIIKAKEKLRNRVNDAYAIAYKIYNKNKNIKTEKEIQYLIITTLQNITYESDTYFFINSNQGRAILFNKKSYLDTNKNIWNLKDEKGTYFIQKQSNIALNKKEGFIDNFFVKPNAEKSKPYDKLTFIKLFEPYNWHIGMGFYIDNLTNETKDEVLKYIASIRYGEDGYFFINSLDKKALINDGRRAVPPINYPNDSLFQKQLDAIKNPAGGFFFYKFKKLNSSDKYEKLAFIKEYKKWEWIIGTGAYMDELDNELLKKQKQLKNAIIIKSSIILFIFIFIFILIYFVSKKITSFIELNIINLISLFNSASSNLKKINLNKFSFVEFRTIAKKLNKTLKLRNKAEKRVRDLLEIINKNVIITTTDISGKILSANDSFCKISGYTEEELIGQSHNIVRHPDMPKETYKQMWKALLNGEVWEGEIKNRNKSGITYWVKATIYPTFNKEKIKGYTAIRQDITDKKRVEYLSITDELTQTYNRRYFNTKIEEEINRAKRNNYYLAFIMLDIDYFKLYNDTYGHQEGDEVLVKVSQVLIKHTARASDFTFRLGGEEFGILFSYKNEEESLEYANSIKDEIEALQIEHKKNKTSPYLTISLGLVVREGKKLESVDTVYKLADEALYKAKESGRNKVCVSI